MRYASIILRHFCFSDCCTWQLCTYRGDIEKDHRQGGQVYASCPDPSNYRKSYYYRVNKPTFVFAWIVYLLCRYGFCYVGTLQAFIAR